MTERAVNAASNVLPGLSGLGLLGRKGGREGGRKGKREEEGEGEGKGG